MKRKTSRQLTPAQQAEIEALAALPDEQIDTQDIPELSDWSGKQRGLFFQGEQQVTNEQNSQDYRDNPVTIRQVIIRWLPQDFFSLIVAISLVVAIGYYIYSHDLLLLTIFTPIVGFAMGRIFGMAQQRKKEASVHSYQYEENELGTHRHQPHS